MQRMGDSYFWNKKAVSDVVATVLITMITIAAVGILWVAIIPMVQEGMGISNVCKDAGVSIISSQGYTCYKPNNITMVQVSKASTKVNVTGLKFSVSLDGNSFDYDDQKVAYSTEEYDVFYLNTSEFGKIEKVSVVPIINLGSSEKSCSIISLEDVPLCSSNLNLVEVSNGKLIGRSGGSEGSGESSDTGSGACVLDCSCSVTALFGTNCTDPICNTNCSGTRRDGSILAPFAIYNWSDLNNVRNNLTASYILMNNLDKNSANYLTTGGNWMPVGNSTLGYYFSGNFNGNNNTLSDLIINKPTINYVGLFGYTTGNISNIGLIKVNISGKLYVGGLAGYSNSGTISNSYATGNVTGFQDVGGLVGHSGAIISNSYATGNINGSQNVGGLVGASWRTISNSYATGNVMGSSLYVGGLVGASTGGNISNSYATGNVTGSVSYVGGLVGGCEGKINNSYSTGKVIGIGNWVGGLVGWLSQPSGAIFNSHWLNYSQGLSCWKNDTGGYNINCTAIVNSNLAYFYNYNNAPMNSWDFTNIWAIDSAKNNGYPYLKWQS